MDNVIEIPSGPAPTPLPPPLPSVPPTPVSAVDPLKVQKTLAQLMAVSRGLTRLTDWDGDDKVVAFLEPIVTTAEFAGLLAFLIDQFKDKPVTIEAVREALRSHLGL